jgi:hypothetical protein
MANQVDGQSVGRIADVTPSDTTRFGATIGLACLVSGNANILCVGDTVPHIVYLNAGQWYPVRAIAVYSTSTAATGITALYQS